MKSNTGMIHTQCAATRKQAWQVANRNTKIEPGGNCKIAISEGDITEHLWVLVTEVAKACYIGTINNDPFMLKQIKYGDIIAFQHHQIEDYLND